MANINLAAWEKLEKVTTSVGTVFVPCHLGAASGTENVPRQNPWLSWIALVSGTPALILCCQKNIHHSNKKPQTNHEKTSICTVFVGKQTKCFSQSQSSHVDISFIQVRYFHFRDVTEKTVIAISHAWQTKVLVMEESILLGVFEISLQIQVNVRRSDEDLSNWTFTEIKSNCILANWYYLLKFFCTSKLPV